MAFETTLDAPESERTGASEPAHLPQRHSSALFVISAAKLFERTAYYGARTLLILYMVFGLQYDQSEALSIYGTFGSSFFVLGLFGGLIADFWLGSKRTLIWTGFMVVLGLGVMSGGENLFVPGLILFAIGSGLSAPNSGVLLAKSYLDRKHLLDSGFTIHYVGINIGAILGSLVIALVGEELGYTWGFACAAVTMLLGQIILILGNKHISVEKRYREQAPNVEAGKIKGSIPLLLMILVLNVAFWTSYELGGGKVYSLFKELIESVDSHQYVSFIHSLTPTLVICIGIGSGILWSFWRFPSVWKCALGVLLFAIGFALLWLPEITLSVVIAIFVFRAFAELLFVPIFSSILAQYVPVRWMGTVFGGALVSFGMASSLSGFLRGSADGVLGGDFFYWILGATVALAIGLLLIWINNRQSNPKPVDL